jgi:hypothetical protein
LITPPRALTNDLTRPSIEKKFIDRATVSARDGAGGDPLGEPPASPFGMLERLPDEMREKLPDELVDELLAGARTADEIVGPGGLLAQLTKRLVERALEGSSLLYAANATTAG